MSEMNEWMEWEWCFGKRPTVQYLEFCPLMFLKNKKCRAVKALDRTSVLIHARLHQEMFQWMQNEHRIVSSNSQWYVLNQQNFSSSMWILKIMTAFLITRLSRMTTFWFAFEYPFGEDISVISQIYLHIKLSLNQQKKDSLFSNFDLNGSCWFCSDFINYRRE